jgi:hypothetical protein
MAPYCCYQIFEHAYNFERLTSETVTPMTVKIRNAYSVTVCCMIGKDRRFGGTCCNYLQCRVSQEREKKEALFILLSDPEEGGRKLL